MYLCLVDPFFGRTLTTKCENIDQVKRLYKIHSAYKLNNLFVGRRGVRVEGGDVPLLLRALGMMASWIFAAF